MAEHQTKDGVWCCSSRGSWLPGAYESQKACRLAYRVNPDVLQAAWDAKPRLDDAVLTEAELRDLLPRP